MAKNNITDISSKRKGSIYFEGFSEEQRQKIKKELRFSYNGQMFDIKNIGDMSYGCFMSFRDCCRGAYCIDIINGTGKISVRVRPEGDFASNLERIFENYLNRNKREFSF